MIKQTMEYSSLMISISLLLVVQGRSVVEDEIGGGNREIEQNSIHPDERGLEIKDSHSCQQIKGLPNPESGCCGVQYEELLHKQLNESEQTSHEAITGRFRRSSDSDILPSKLINHGKATDIHGFPWTVYLYRKPIYNFPGLSKRLDSCGGTIISSRYVITAAHCLEKFNNVSSEVLSHLEIILAEYDTNSYPRDCTSDTKCIQNMKMSVERVIIHPKYNNSVLRNDVALVKLSSDIPHTEYIRPICLPKSDIEDVRDKALFIAGWGKDGDKRSNLKQAAAVNYVTSEDCKSAYSFKDGSISCLVGEQGEDVCDGDSGGPVMVYSGDKYFLAGVVNGKRETEQCGSSVPSLFNNVFHHKEWIVREVDKYSK